MLPSRMNNRSRRTMTNILKNRHRHTMTLTILVVIIPVVITHTIQVCIPLHIQTLTDEIDQRADLIMSERNVHQHFIQGQEIREMEIPEEEIRQVLHHDLDQQWRLGAVVAFIRAEAKL